MYAIVEVLGKQYRVQEGQKVVVDLMDAEKGSEISLDRVLMIGGEAAKIGTPVVEGAKVNATVVDHILGDKIVVFKHKRRKAERRTQGHRQQYTVLTVTGIVAAIMLIPFSLEAGAVVDLAALKQAGLVKKEHEGVKILSNGELSKALTIKAAKFSKAAEEKIKAVGGTVEVA
mgnify:CR=1 FL=1